MRARSSRRGCLRRVSVRIDGSDGAGVANATGVWRQRDSVLLRLEEDGMAGFGEASPLPGYSPDSVDEAEAWLQRWIDAGCPDDMEAVESPSARFAVEAARLDLEGRRTSKPAWRLLGGAAVPSSLAVQGLVTPASPDDTRRRARELYDAGFRTLKLKVGSDSHWESSRMAALRRELGDRVSLRLDANRSLPVGDALATLQAWSAFGVEWIEEPCSEPGPVDSPIALALDETLQDRWLPGSGWQVVETWIEAAPYSALVLKPTVLGLAGCLDLARMAQRTGLEMVVSHCFEGPLALQACAHLALAIGGRGAHGLARHAALGPWTDIAGLMVEGPGIEPARRIGDGLGLDCEGLWATGDPL